MRGHEILTITICILLTGLLVSTSAAEQPDFNRDIAPILSDNCYQCHGPDEAARQADLRLDKQRELLDVAGDRQDLAESELLRRITSDDPDEVMPPPSTKRSLNAAQQKLLTDWVASGAKWAAHWSFEKPRRPALPQIQHKNWPTNAIDSFVLRRLESQGLTPSTRATRQRLIRRVTLDLTGLPPTLEEIDSFLSDPSPRAYAKVVERLLASPRFGERMSVDWLDAARYADTNGYQGDRERTMWPWRDWVVQALNSNQPYDQFTVWQLAGDLLPSSTREQKLATGFCRNHMINGEGGRIPEENRVEYIFDQIETLGTVWMGLTVQCSRCHDHKFDPIQQSEYYQLFAFFNQTPINGGGGDPQMAPNMTVPSRSQRRQLAMLATARANSELPLLKAETNILSDDTCDLPNDAAAALKTDISDRKPEQWKVLEEHLSQRFPNFSELAKNYRAAQDELNKAKNVFPKVMIMQDRPAGEPRETFILEKGLYNQRRATVTADTPSFLPPLPTAALPHESVNRLALARWLTSNDHPLTARVTVNRIWQMFFGTGLVKTTEDFGTQGEKPSHPELLDWLACEFMASGWDLKYLTRLITMSSTYRQSARVSVDLFQRDPENRLLARGPRQRMPSWMIRDHALAASGLLVGRIGGPPVKPYQPEGVWAEASFGKKRYTQDHAASLYRRSLYVYWRRIVGPTMFFDMAKRQTCSVKSSQTNTPLHALVTLNDITYVEAARAMATDVMTVANNNAERLGQAFRRATSRKPSAETTSVLLQRLDKLLEHYRKDKDAADQLVQVGELAVDNELDEPELAAYTALCLMLLNLDEALNK